jgi:pimeloyl-ACP methyl ester carboxylesterase
MAEIRVSGTVVAVGRLNVAAAAPGVFFTINQDGKMSSALEPVRRGDPLTIFGTGYSELSAALADGQAGPTPALSTKATPQVTLGGVNAEVRSSVLVPGAVGLWRINVIVPLNAPPGDNTPLLVTQGSTSNRVALRVVAGREPDPTESQPLALKEMGMFFVGGRKIAAPFIGAGGGGGGGMATQWTEQSLVHYLIPENRSQKLPIVMVPGLGLTSYMYLSTPDERAGWAQHFVKRGYAVYVFDDPLTGPSGFDVNPFNGLRAGRVPAADVPNFAIWSNEVIWNRWGLGAAADRPYDNTRFPVRQVDQFQRAIPPRSAPAGDGDEVGLNALKVRALRALLDRVGPCILMTHSAGGAIGFEANLQKPELVKAMVVLEPTGCPTVQTEVSNGFKDKSFLAVYGDYIQERGQTGRLNACRTTAGLVRGLGNTGEVLVLPELGIRGNTHLFTQDNNNDEIARMVIRWLEANVRDN